MDISRLFEGLLLLSMVMLGVQLLGRIDGWHAAVAALHLRWEREQRQAGATGVSLHQRQRAQAEFERLVTSLPMRLIWLHVILSLGAVGLVMALAWRSDDVAWSGFWLAIPIGGVILLILGYGYLLISQANAKLATISTSLYGPAPPRVKVRSIQTGDSPS